MCYINLHLRYTSYAPIVDSQCTVSRVSQRLYYKLRMTISLQFSLYYACPLQTINFIVVY